MLLHYPGQHLQIKLVMRTIPQNSYIDKIWNSALCYMTYSLKRKGWETKLTHPDSLKLLAFKLQTLQTNFLIISFFNKSRSSIQKKCSGHVTWNTQKIIKIISLYEISQIIMYIKKTLERYRDDELYSYILKQFLSQPSIPKSLFAFHKKF